MRATCTVGQATFVALEGRHTCVEPVDQREGNVEAQILSRTIYAVDTQKHTGKDACCILPAVDKVGKDVSGIFVTP